MSTSLNRRSIIGAAAALPLIGTGGALASESTFPPELVARLERLRQRWKAQMAKERDRHAAFKQAFLAATGVTRDAWHKLPPGSPLFEKLSAVAESLSLPGDDDERDADGNSVPWNEINDELFTLADEVMEQPVRCLADLALQAQIIGLTDGDLLDEQSADDEGAAYRLSALLENVADLAGKELLITPVFID